MHNNARPPVSPASNRSAIPKLTDIVPVSPAAYREIAPAIIDGTIEFRGEQIPIARENAVKIKAAVTILRNQIERAESDNVIRSPPNITSLQIRFDAYCKNIRRLIRRSAPADTTQASARAASIIASPRQSPTALTLQ